MFPSPVLIALLRFCKIICGMETQLLKTAALLSPFLVARLQLLRGHPQEDVVLFLGVVVLVALKRRKITRQTDDCIKSHVEVPPGKLTKEIERHSVTVRDILNQHVDAASYL